MAAFRLKQADGVSLETTSCKDASHPANDAQGTPERARGGWRTVVCGAGATGLRIARLIAADPKVRSVQLCEIDEQRRAAIAASLGPSISLVAEPAVAESTDVVVIATPTGTQVSLARAAVAVGAAVVTTSNEVAETRDLLAAGHWAEQHGVTLIVGAGYMPGYTCLLARLGAAEFDAVDEIHVAKAGTGGPACARQHHRALSSLAIDWRAGRWMRRAGGSGRELCWFPEPVAGRDCYRGALPDALLLVSAFPGVDRITARMAATRRDRLTAPLPMLRRPHPEGDVGAVRVELRGWRGSARHVVVLGSHRRPAEAAAIVASQTALHVVGVDARAGSAGLADIAEPDRLLRSVTAQGLRPVRFDGFDLAL